MESKELMSLNKKGPSRFSTIILLAIMAFSLFAAPLVVIKETMGAIEAFSSMQLQLPFLTKFYLGLGNVLSQFWYLLIFLAFFVLGIGVLLEAFVKGSRRWLNIIFSSSVSILCWLMTLVCLWAMTLPLSDIEKAIKK